MADYNIPMTYLGPFTVKLDSPVVASEIFLMVFFKKYKLYNLIKREIHILTTITTIKKLKKNKKKIHKYIKFTIAFYEFSYFEISA